MLPIKFIKNVPFLKQDLAIKAGAKISKKYKEAKPYPNIVIDNFLPNTMANNLLKNFPLAKKNKKDGLSNNYFESNKRQISPYECSETLNYFLFFNSLPFLQYLEEVTGIQGLIADPYFNGGGFHEISTGGKLGIHADFRLNKNLHVQRRINVLIYLNKNWKKNYGGYLELWDKKMRKKVLSTQPIFNRCVIFNTDSDAFHGHPDPLNTPENITRKSLALYYYTASKSIYNEIEGLTTQFQGRNINEVKKLKMHKKTKKKILQLITPPFLFVMTRKIILAMRDFFREQKKKI